MPSCCSAHVPHLSPPQAFMLRICPASCGICTEMDKDEL